MTIEHTKSALEAIEEAITKLHTLVPETNVRLTIASLRAAAQQVREMESELGGASFIPKEREQRVGRGEVVAHRDRAPLVIESSLVLLAAPNTDVTQAGWRYEAPTTREAIDAASASGEPKP